MFAAPHCGAQQNACQSHWREKKNNAVHGEKPSLPFFALDLSVKMLFSSDQTAGMATSSPVSLAAVHVTVASFFWGF